jgi:hypothetical protein
MGKEQSLRTALFLRLRLCSGGRRNAKADSSAALRNDNKKTGNRKRRSPPGMTTRKAATNGNGKGNRNRQRTNTVLRCVQNDERFDGTTKLGCG